MLHCTVFALLKRPQTRDNVQLLSYTHASSVLRNGRENAFNPPTVGVFMQISRTAHTVRDLIFGILMFCGSPFATKHCKIPRRIACAMFRVGFSIVFRGPAAALSELRANAMKLISNACNSILSFWHGIETDLRVDFPPWPSFRFAASAVYRAPVNSRTAHPRLRLLRNLEWFH